MNILIVLTSHDTLGDTGRKTGFWLEEFAAPYYVFVDAGAKVALASPAGGQPPLDPKSDEPDAQTEATRRFRQDPDAQRLLAATRPLADVQAADYDAVFVPGGHGPMEDLAVDADAGALLIAADEAQLPLGIVCHGPAILLAANNSDGVNAFAGRTVTGFSNAEEEQAGLADKAPWLLQDRLTQAGFKVTLAEPWTVHIETDGNLLTGQNPASSESLARTLLDRLENVPQGSK